MKCSTMQLVVKRPYLELKTQPKQLLGSLPLDGSLINLAFSLRVTQTSNNSLALIWFYFFTKINFLAFCQNNTMTMLKKTLVIITLLITLINVMLHIWFFTLISKVIYK